MNPEVIQYINSQHIAVLAAETADGAPHAAAIHFALVESPLSIIMLTGKSFKKCEGIREHGKARASMVIGMSEAEMKTVQMDGEVIFVDEAFAYKQFFAKFPDNVGRYNAETDVFLQFTPHWWRYTNFKAAGGPKFIASENFQA